MGGDRTSASLIWVSLFVLFFLNQQSHRHCINDFPGQLTQIERCPGSKIPIPSPDFHYIPSRLTFKKNGWMNSQNPKECSDIPPSWPSSPSNHSELSKNITNFDNNDKHAEILLRRIWKAYPLQLFCSEILSVTPNSQRVIPIQPDAFPCRTDISFLAIFRWLVTSIQNGSKQISSLEEVKMLW